MVGGMPRPARCRPDSVEEVCGYCTTAWTLEEKPLFRTAAMIICCRCMPHRAWGMHLQHLQQMPTRVLMGWDGMGWEEMGAPGDQAAPDVAYQVVILAAAAVHLNKHHQGPTAALRPHGSQSRGHNQPYTAQPLPLHSSVAKRCTTARLHVHVHVAPLITHSTLHYLPGAAQRTTVVNAVITLSTWVARTCMQAGPLARTCMQASRSCSVCARAS